MMTPAEFVRAWLADASEYDEGLVTAAPTVLAGINISDSAKTFLTEAGLPAAAAPFLSFDQLTAAPLPTLAEACELPHDEAARQIYCIGSNGYGDVICLHENGQVWVYNHDNNMEPCFVNTSVAQLAACLLAYRQLLADSVRITGSARNEDLPPEVVARFRMQLQQIDPDAYAGVQDEQGQLLPSMWQQELRALGNLA